MKINSRIPNLSSCEGKASQRDGRELQGERVLCATSTARCLGTSPSFSKECVLLSSTRSWELILAGFNNCALVEGSHGTALLRDSGVW